jgi:hypothetical protein
MSGMERRRSDRLLLTIPLRLEGVDARGREFKAEARTVILNRHGARIQLKHLLKAGLTVRLVNLINRRAADFRVVGPTEPYSEERGEYGVATLNPEINVWGIQFPPPSESEVAAPKALVECRRCHTVALLRLTLVEVEVLESAGIFSRLCEKCGQPTPWGHAEQQVAIESPPGEEEMFRAARTEAATSKAKRRQHRRVALQLPTLVRDYYGGAEITKTENVSMGGFCFTSEKTYQLGEAVMVICPYDPAAGQSIEVRSKIARRQEIKGTHKRIYGVRYDPKPDESAGAKRT